MPNSRQFSRIRHAAGHFVLLIIGGALIGPIAWTVMTSLKSPSEAFSLPPRLLFVPTAENFGRVFEYLPFGRYLANSLLVGVATTLLSLLVSTMAAYALVRYEFRFRNFVFKSMLLTRTVPAAATVIPLFIMFRSASLLDNPIALILTYTAYNIGLVTWMLVAFLADIPLDMEEAAMVDGATELQAFRLVTLPLVAPGLAAAGVFAFLAAWNEFLYALIFMSKNQTLPVAIASSITEVGVRWGEATAMASMALIPVVLYAVLMGRWMLQGLTLGAVK